MAIAKITRAYIRHYRDNGQTTAYVEWMDGRGVNGRTEGAARKAGCDCQSCGQPLPDDWRGMALGAHMAALFNRAEREGVAIGRETW